MPASSAGDGPAGERPRRPLRFQNRHLREASAAAPPPEEEEEASGAPYRKQREGRDGTESEGLPRSSAHRARPAAWPPAPGGTAAAAPVPHSRCPGPAAASPPPSAPSPLAPHTATPPVLNQRPDRRLAWRRPRPAFSGPGHYWARASPQRRPRGGAAAGGRAGAAAGGPQPRTGSVVCPFVGPDWPGPCLLPKG